MAAPTPERRFKNPVVFICDIQEKFRPAIYEFDKVILTARKLLHAATALRIPIFVTTQNRARLGETVAELQPLLAAAGALVQADLDKTRFSMWLPAVASHPVFSFSSSSATATTSPSSTATASTSPAEVVIAGIESHICVTQTALDLLAAGHRVYVLADGVSSAHREEVPVALARLRQAGAVVTTSESWLYECMGDAGVPEFKAVVKLVKETGPDTKAALQALVGSKI
ncbi:uncharacterized protein THITE_2119541 [Thermothielavioides terrestris NRRL 8126]|uniref:Isochorismatase-like domain-containing protein n=1 Tax=Thermothielavioides terrestris (strain ATCC 38088 / NRRL 8126) TaxID=578455 RepID=G2RBY0_THETT|nr:uncharacterized protein THITE_2119541 [Thermothielavioides terrestris NRRL 8126]AEO69301.1 hypothetical protein THITE_2119541 [Thermothielavioides terrestris NRRL 8126]